MSYWEFPKSMKQIFTLFSHILYAHIILVSANFRQSHMDVMVQQHSQYSIMKKDINRSLMLWTLDKLCNHGNQTTPKQQQKTIPTKWKKFNI